MASSGVESPTHSSIEAALSRADDLLAAGQVEEAGKIYRELYDRNPRLAQAAYGLGAIAYRQGYQEFAIDYGGQALQLEPDNPEFLNLAGLACSAVGHFESALVHFRKARKLKPDNEDFLSNFRHAVLKVLPIFDDYARDQFNTQSYTAAAEIDLHCGDWLREVGEVAIAEAYFRRGLSSRPPLAGNPPIADPALEVDKSPTTLWEVPVPSRTTVQLGREPDLRSVAHAPVYAKLYQRIGELHLERGEIVEGEVASREAIALDATLPEAYMALGNALARKGDIHAAADAYAAAIERKPDYAEALSNLATLFLSKRQFEEAQQCYERAIAAQPDNAALCWNLGVFWETQAKFAPAVEWWTKALALNPKQQQGPGYYKIGCALNVLGKGAEALEWFERAIQVEPTFWSAHYDLCEMLVAQHDLDRARPAVERLWRIAQDKGSEVDRVTAMSVYLKALCFIGLGHLARNLYFELEPLIYEVLPRLPFQSVLRLYVNLLFDVPHIRDDVAANNKLAFTLAKRYQSDLAAQQAQFNQNTPAIFTPSRGKRVAHLQPYDGVRPLRLGFISKHFRRHSVGWCSAHIMEHLKQLTPHLFFYVTGEMNRDDRTAIFEGLGEKMVWPGSGQLPDGSARSIIRCVSQDTLDVLVDLDSITVLPHAEVLDNRPAPVCATWLGYDAPHINAKNYNIVDWHTHPAGVEHYYVEKLIRLPGSFAAISGLPIAKTDRQLLRRSQRLDDSQTAYLCVATGQKVSPEVISAQVHILRHVPNSVLFYKGRIGDLPTIYQLYREECDRQGVSHRRIRFLPRTASEEEHRATYLLCDVLLDSYPYSGATHNLEALWFNLPLVTRVGEQSFARLGYSLLRAAGLEEGATWTWEEYIDWGIRLGRDRALRDSIQAKLAQGKQPGQLQPLWDPKQFAANLYGIFQDLRSKADSDPNLTE